MEAPVRVETFESEGIFRMHYFFRIVDDNNNEILAQSQKYKSWRQRDATAKRLARLMGCEVTKGRVR